MPVSENRVELTAPSKATLEKLKKADLMPGLKKELNSATRGVQPAVRKAARSIPSTRSRRNTPGGSLRNAIASAVKRTFRVSGKQVFVSIRINPKGGKSNLARLVEGEIAPWTHPTYGHEPTVTQLPHPFFYPTINEMLPEISTRIEHAIDEYEKML